jgi:hypothetical protein
MSGAEWVFLIAFAASIAANLLLAVVLAKTKDELGLERQDHQFWKSRCQETSDRFTEVIRTLRDNGVTVTTREPEPKWVVQFIGKGGKK